MILRAIDAAAADALPQSGPARTADRGASPLPIWEALEENQKRLSTAREYWLITQPAHSALSGDIAAKMDASAFGKFDEPTIRAIALHDAGWSALDSEAIRASRGDDRQRASGRNAGRKSPGTRSHPNAQKVGIKVGQPNHEKFPPIVSFVSVAPNEAVQAWTDSIETALKASAVGGYLVSEHFRSLAAMQQQAKPETAPVMLRFIAQEDARQRKLRAKIHMADVDLQRLVDGLRFCDLLSLCICAGLTETVELSQQIAGRKIVLRPIAADTLKIVPSPFKREEMFGFAALRHPRTQLVSSASFAARITA